MRIKVTAYIDPEDLSDDWRDSSHPMGLSEVGYEEHCHALEHLGMTDIEFEQVQE